MQEKTPLRSIKVHFPSTTVLPSEAHRVDHLERRHKGGIVGNAEKAQRWEAQKQIS